MPMPAPTGQHGRSAPVAPSQPTWRDLPGEPPYGPVAPQRTANIGPAAFVPPAAEDEPGITPGQIALAVGGTLLLVAIGIGAAMLLLRDDDPALAEATPPAAAPQDPFDDPAPPDPQPAPDQGQGQLEPSPTPEATDGDPQDQPADPGSAEPGADEPGAAPQEPGAAAPPTLAPEPQDPQAPPPGDEDQDLELPRLFELRTLPAGMDEDSTTVRQTTRDDEVVTEQTTLLAVDGGGEVTVRATRSSEASSRFESLVAAEGAEEVTVRGAPAFLLADGRLVWVVPAGAEDDPGTLLEIDAPDGVGTDAVLTLGQGLELLR